MATPLFSRCDLAGPYRLPAQRLPAVQEEISSSGLSTIRIEPGTATDRPTWLQEAARQLQLPEHFGGNFDALYDCLCDRECLPQTTLVLLIADTSALGEEGTDTLIAVLQAAADEWREQERALWTLFLAPGLDLDPLPTPKA